MPFRRIALCFLFLCCLLSGCSREPAGDEFTGVWESPDHTLEFLAPNAVVWTKTSTVRRSYKKDGRRVKEKEARVRDVRFGLYRREGAQLRVVWPAGNNPNRYGVKETEFEILELGEQTLQLRCQDPSWTSLSKAKTALEVTLSRNKQLEAGPYVGLWRSAQRSQFEGRAITPSGVLIDLGESSPFSIMAGHPGRVHDTKGFVEKEEGELEVRDLNYVGYDGQRVWRVFYERDGSTLSFLSERQREKGRTFEEGYVMERVVEPLGLDKSHRIKWNWPEVKK